LQSLFDQFKTHAPKQLLAVKTQHRPMLACFHPCYARCKDFAQFPSVDNPLLNSIDIYINLSKITQVLQL